MDLISVQQNLKCLNIFGTFSCYVKNWTEIFISLLTKLSNTLINLNFKDENFYIQLLFLTKFTNL